MMVHAAEQRGAADDVVEQYADYSDDHELHRALMADEQFGTLALIKKQLDVQATYCCPTGEVEDYADQAADAINAALDARAEQICAEVQDHAE